jgi:mRNA interferase YafQ
LNLELINCLYKKFKKDYKHIGGKKSRIEELKSIIVLLAEKKKLERKYHDHPLKGEYKDCNECHIEPDYLLIYKIRQDTLILIRCGSHSELFE